MEDERISRTQRKKEAGALQKLAFKKIENWRDELRQGDFEIIEEILTDCPVAERQRLTQLARNAYHENNNNKGAKSSRMLFRYLKRVSDF
jgi:ribosome-associated protein